VLRQSRHARPASPEPRVGSSTRVAYVDRWRRIEHQRINHLWLDAYHAARERLAGGFSEVEFPYGTYKLRVESGVRCARAPD